MKYCFNRRIDLFVIAVLVLLGGANFMAINKPLATGWFQQFRTAKSGERKSLSVRPCHGSLQLTVNTTQKQHSM